MPHNVLIAGRPGIGKTSLINRLYRDLTPLYIRGFYKEAIFENNILKGYRISAFNFRELILAHIHIEGPDRFADFGLNLDGFDAIVNEQLRADRAVELFLIDEIGPMECRSELFRKSFLELLDSDIPVIATLTSIDVLKTLSIENRKDLVLLKMTISNRESMWKNVLLEISKNE
jgi:nucleoside-triphosphatase